ncbi:MAG: flagellar motor protein MotB [Turicibacter sp.]|nr:flagellar motor protein MotB [Turicibacter sp.]
MKKKKREAPVNNWMNTYADMVTLLFCFFVLLFAFSEVDAQQFTAMAEALAGRNILTRGALGSVFNDSAGLMPSESPPIPPRQNPEAPINEDVTQIAQVVSDRVGQMNAMADAFQTYMAPYDIAEELGIRVDALGEYMVISFPSGMLFNVGEDELLPSALEMLNYVATWLTQFPGHRIVIRGHTDSMPIGTERFRSNMHLAAGRAISVFYYLVDVHGFDPALVEPTAHGEFIPIDTNYTVEGRANNRRVEIYVFAQQVGIEVVQGANNLEVVLD